MILVILIEPLKYVGHCPVFASIPTIRAYTVYLTRGGGRGWF